MKSIVIGLSALAAAASIHATAPASGANTWDQQLAFSLASARPARKLPQRSWAPQDPADSLWRVARQAIAEEDYQRAADLFDRIAERYPESEYAGDSLYWKAYALYQMGRQRDLESAVAALDRMDRAYPNARMRREARDLRARVLVAQARQGDPGAARTTAEMAGQLPREHGCPSDDDDMRVAALQGLMQMDAESALPILQKVLARRDECSERLREQAVFILSQKRGDDVTSMLLDAARHDPSPDVRGAAVQWLSRTRSPRAVAALDSILATADDPEMANHALFALSQIGDQRSLDALRRYAGDETRPTETRAQAVFWLGQRGGSTELPFLRDLFSKTRSEEIRGHIIQAIARNGGADATTWLLDMARDKTVPAEARGNAIFWSGQHGASVEQLSSLYDALRGETDLQNRLVFALSRRREAAATDKLMAIAARDPDPELRKQAIFWLGQKHDPRVTQFLLDIINK